MTQYRSANEARSKAGGAPENCPLAKRQLNGVTPPFDAKQQYVSNQGAHKFVAPSGNDQRGPCPGLNAMANHGYLPYNGVGTITDFINGCQEALGMGADIATVLAVYGAVFDGDLTSYSIGGPHPSLLNLGGPLNTPQGLSGSNNKYEGEWEFGGSRRAYKIPRPTFPRINSKQPLLLQRTLRRSYSSTSGVGFTYRFMGNKSAEHPTGLLDGETLKAFYSVTGDYPNFKYTPGYEKFPDNWYKRNLVDYYTIPYVVEDSVIMEAQYPEFFSVGGNTGKTNSFVGVNPSDLTGGVFNADSLLEGNNMFCYGLQASVQEAPDILSGLFTDVSAALNKLTSAVNPVASSLGCPKLDSINKAQFNMRNDMDYTRVVKEMGGVVL
ncbi:hypothetical protein BCR34DRAFT_662784 [Clohesyomyces aquaticus]|uniref:Heme haloperoxidase family profile domain-containing protein n=1 Tax=Clohesyomyces aquaticus TaxID=1231657 RepID=A0A1Y1ZVA1_9PLEO|nr:hypothetical protein BCR34DRAFT_662784 [Clohesyomyces aquaticus]